MLSFVLFCISHFHVSHFKIVSHIFLYVFFSKYNTHKPRVPKITQTYSLDIDFDKLNLYQKIFFTLKNIEYKPDKELLYKIYDWPVLSNGYDKIQSKIIEGKKKETEEVTIIKERTEKDNSSKILEKLKELRNKKNEKNSK